MKKFLLSLFSAFLLFCKLHGQGIVRGKITDKNGETIIGASVVLKANKGIGVVTDFDGNYSLKITDATPQALIISFVSFKTIEETVNPLNGEVVIKNFVMQSAAQEVGEVKIVAKAVKAREYYVENMKRNAATTIDYVSSETMKKTGDANITAAVSRVAGVSTNGAFITIRGIGDRYVKTAINGSRIPTLDPFTNNIKLDLFPASLVDNVLITKTASPDMPGDWAGAYLSVETKDYPEQLSINLESTFGYNNQSTFKDVLTSDHSKTDWLGYDNSFRDRNHSQFSEANMSPTQYQELVALGLGDYYNSLGVNANNWTQDQANGDTYFKLGLVQLGLLAPALIDDAEAIAAAKAAYLNGSYKNDAFAKINANTAATGKSFPDNWNTYKRQGPLNFSQSFSIGNQINLFGKPLGFIAGFRYGSATQYDPNSTSNRETPVSNGIDSGVYILRVSSRINQQATRETNGWSGLMNIAYKFNTNHSCALMFMPNFTATNNVFYANDYAESADRNKYFNTQLYEQRKQLVYQFKSEHYIPGPKLKAELNASYTKGQSSIPDFKNLEYDKITAGGNYVIGRGIGDEVRRYYRYLDDNLFDSRLSFELPFKTSTAGVRKIKAGIAYQRNDKESKQYQYAVELGPHNSPLLNDDIDAYLNLQKFEMYPYTDNFGQTTNTFDAYYVQYTNDADHTIGWSSVQAAFVLADYSISPRIRIAGGLRAEKAEIFTDVFAFDSAEYAVNDPRRFYESGKPLANPGTLNTTDFLPSANVIYKIKNDEETPWNLRLNYSRTTARPSIRELMDVEIYDPEFRGNVFGNSNLKPVTIDNYDVRFETYFKSGDNASLSVFYKKFKNHIELVNSGGYSWQNVDKSYVVGIELEGRKMITHHFEFRANVALIKSNSKFVRNRMEINEGPRVYIPVDTVSRTMFGQAPYVVNSMLTYNFDSLGMTVTVGYNVQGARLVIASDNSERPDVYELPRHLFDIKITSKLGKHFGVSFTVKDVLNSPVRRSYNNNDGFTLDYDNYQYGTNYLLGFSYKL